MCVDSWMWTSLICSCFQPHFKESETYLLQFRQCLSRALGHIRTYVTNILTAATQAVTPQKVSITLNLFMRCNYYRSKEFWNVNCFWQFCVKIKEIHFLTIFLRCLMLVLCYTFPQQHYVYAYVWSVDLLWAVLIRERVKIIWLCDSCICR